MEIIRSKDNKIVKELKKLKQKKYRDFTNKFLAEGIKFLDYIEYIPELIIAREDMIDNSIFLKKIKNFNTKILYLDEKIFNELSAQENSQGVIIQYQKKEGNLDSISNDIIVLDDISDPGNLGTIIRVCDATNFKDIILTKGSVDAYNDKVIRASMGSILNVNLIYLDRNFIINLLVEEKYNTFITYLDKTAVSYNKIKLQNKNAIVMGNEGRGVGNDFLEILHTKTIIPILGNAESLNVAIASSLMLYKFRELQNIF